MISAGQNVRGPVVSVADTKERPGLSPAFPPKVVESLRQAEDMIDLQMDMAEARKAKAREKVRELKERLSSMAITALVDPAGYARALRRMAGELKLAVESYAEGDLRDLERQYQDLSAWADAKRQEHGPQPESVQQDGEESWVTAYQAAALEWEKDDRFLDDVVIVRQSLKAYFEAAANRATKEDRKELDRDAGAFNEAMTAVEKGMKKIHAWRIEAEPHASLAVGAPVNLRV